LVRSNPQAARAGACFVAKLKFQKFFGAGQGLSGGGSGENNCKGVVEMGASCGRILGAKKESGAGGGCGPLFSTQSHGTSQRGASQLVAGWKERVISTDKHWAQTQGGKAATKGPGDESIRRQDEGVAFSTTGRKHSGTLVESGYFGQAGLCRFAGLGDNGGQAFEEGFAGGRGSLLGGRFEEFDAELHLSRFLLPPVGFFFGVRLLFVVVEGGELEVGVRFLKPTTKKRGIRGRGGPFLNGWRQNWWGGPRRNRQVGGAFAGGRSAFTRGGSDVSA